METATWPVATSIRDKCAGRQGQRGGSAVIPRPVDANVPVPVRTGETGVRVRNSVMGVTEHDESWTLGAGTFGVRANFMEEKLSFKS